MRNIEFELPAFREYNEWALADRKIFKKLIKLMEDCRRNPFEGIGKPEPLKHNLKDCWSRRITQEHRFVYQVTEEAIIVISCKYHY